MTESSPLRVATLATTRTARYATAGSAAGSAQRWWMGLHGYGQTAASFLKPVAPVLPADTLCVAAEGLNRFYREMPRPDGSHLQRVGATWMTRENREDDIADTVAWLSRLHTHVQRDLPRGAAIPLGVLAFSQGVATAMRWLAHARLSPRMLVLWAGGLPHDVEGKVLHGVLHSTRVVVVTGTRDAFVSDARVREMQQTLDEWQVRAEWRTFDGEHHLDAPLLGALFEELRDA
jgi:predicted esterase